MEHSTSWAATCRSGGQEIFAPFMKRESSLPGLEQTTGLLA